MRFEYLQKNLHALLRRQTEIVLTISPVGFGMAGEFSNRALHQSIIPRPTASSQTIRAPGASLVTDQRVCTHGANQNGPIMLTRRFEQINFQSFNLLKRFARDTLKVAVHPGSRFNNAADLLFALGP